MCLAAGLHVYLVELLDLLQRLDELVDLAPRRRRVAVVELRDLRVYTFVMHIHVLQQNAIRLVKP